MSAAVSTEHKPTGAKRKRLSEQQAEKEDKYAEDLASPPPVKKSRVRKSTTQVSKKPRGKTGKLAGLMKMPVDIFVEVASHLDPEDLLHLARANKFLRSILLSKSSRHMWITSFARLNGVPPCPTRLSEPGLASLLYDIYCFHKDCSRRVMKPDFLSQHRLCPLHAAEYHRSTLPQILSAASKIGPWDRCLSQRSLNTFPLTEFARTAIVCRALIRDLTELLEHLTINFPDAAHLTEFQQDTLIAYCEELKAKRKRHTNESIDLEVWFEQQKKNKAGQRQDKAKQRSHEILGNLRKFGWDEKDINDDPKLGFNDEYHSMLFQPTLLTNSIWKRIKPRLETILEGRKTARLQRERDARMDAHASEIIRCLPSIPIVSFPYEDFGTDWVAPLPKTRSHLANLPSLSAIVHNDGLPVTRAVLQGKLDEVSADIRLYRMRVRHNLAKLQREIESEKPLLDYGGQVFEWCKPKVDENYGLLVEEDEANLTLLMKPTCIFSFEATSLARYPHVFKEVALMSKVIEKSREVQSIAKLVLASAGVEDKTEAQLESLEERFVCRSCPANEFIPMGWLSLVGHVIAERNYYSTYKPLVRAWSYSNPDRPNIAWADTHSNVVVGCLDQNAAYTQHIRCLSNSFTDGASDGWHCTLCPPDEEEHLFSPLVLLQGADQPKRVIKAHLRERHGIPAGLEKNCMVSEMAMLDFMGLFGPGMSTFDDDFDMTSSSGDSFGDNSSDILGAWGDIHSDDEIVYSDDNDMWDYR